MPGLPSRELPSAEFLNSHLRYDDVHGHLYRRAGYYVLARADSEMQTGYFVVRLNIDCKQRYFLAHRIIWKMVYGDDPYPEIDHIDRDRSNNRLFNLRLATHKDNMLNRSRGRIGRNSAAFGVYPNKRGRFRAQIMVGSKAVYLGVFDTVEEASLSVSEALASLKPYSRIIEGEDDA